MSLGSRSLTSGNNHGAIAPTGSGRQAHRDRTGREHEYRKFTSTFRRVYIYVSATLRVAGKWDFIRERLALAEAAINAVQLSSPFNAASQARLVCFEDFPVVERTVRGRDADGCASSFEVRAGVGQENRNERWPYDFKAAAAGILRQLSSLNQMRWRIPDNSHRASW